MIRLIGNWTDKKIPESEQRGKKNKATNLRKNECVLFESFFQQIKHVFNLLANFRLIITMCCSGFDNKSGVFPFFMQITGLFNQTITVLFTMNNNTANVVCIKF